MWIMNNWILAGAYLVLLGIALGFMYAASRVSGGGK